jgi:hypothetical protein
MHVSFRSRRNIRSRRRGGFTLLEVMIATAVTLLMMVSLAKIFNIIGESMKQGRSVLELNNRLRSVTDRIRRDLDNMTAIPHPPANPASGLGYLKYYDGMLTDYTFGRYGASLAASVDLSRFGDVDDILMFTARAKAGDAWFTGKVPTYILLGVAPSATNQDLVTIASQHAEIAIFVEPVVSNVGNLDRSMNDLVADPTFFEPVPGTVVPAKYRLYYRTLLIRPDLNLAATGALPNDSAASIMWASPSQVDVNGTAVSLPWPTCDMANPHRQCDLSIRRVAPVNPGLPSTQPGSAVAANSLEDLLDPANRFAHVQIPLTPSTLSMPILALSPKLEIPAMDFEPVNPTPLNPLNPLRFQSSFLHPAFTLGAARTGEDVFASDILAFDVKAFDPSAPLRVSSGPDNAAGVRGDDDDNSGATDDVAEQGWAGSDDVFLTPNDPGYAAIAVTVGTGDYVDLAWGWKTQIQLSAAASDGQLSGTSGTAITDALYKSGLVVHPGTAIALNNLPLIFQPSYDTWTTRYEGDGRFQAELTGSRGAVRVYDATIYGTPPRETWRIATGPSYFVDPATDGIDNNPPPGLFNVAGVDDLSENETSPPFPVTLRGLRVSVRMEDPATREVKQMSVAKEFVTQ